VRTRKNFAVTERIQAANFVRVAVIASVNGFNLGEGLLTQIVDRGTDDLSSKSWNQRSMAVRCQTLCWNDACTL
jgi:hypothetical protein